MADRKDNALKSDEWQAAGVDCPGGRCDDVPLKVIKQDPQRALAGTSDGASNLPTTADFDMSSGAAALMELAMGLGMDHAPPARQPAASAPPTTLPRGLLRSRAAGSEGKDQADTASSPCPQPPLRTTSSSSSERVASRRSSQSAAAPPPPWGPPPSRSWSMYSRPSSYASSASTGSSRPKLTRLRSSFLRRSTVHTFRWVGHDSFWHTTSQYRADLHGHFSGAPLLPQQAQIFGLLPGSIAARPFPRTRATSTKKSPPLAANKLSPLLI
mmetsp:Transcript_31649/g.61764  ORF Transcript_31649/g.61764 Transcript_31649/m.61764 type:complete len:270 (-) Transcript_31649:136-945(-)